jgi:hypothetical protein
MKVVIVYESMYGNTHHVANAIGAGFDGVADVSVVAVDDASPTLVDAADLLVVGGPTHVHGMSRPSTRKAAVEAIAKDESLELDPDAEGPGLRDWFRNLARSAGRAAAFDTRLHAPAVLTGRASKGIAHQLTKLGYEIVAPPESFIVTKATELEPGELARAQVWGAHLASCLLSGTDVQPAT